MSYHKKHAMYAYHSRNGSLNLQNRTIYPIMKNIAKNMLMKINESLNEYTLLPKNGSYIMNTIHTKNF